MGDDRVEGLPRNLSRKLCTSSARVPFGPGAPEAGHHARLLDVESAADAIEDFHTSTSLTAPLRRRDSEFKYPLRDPRVGEATV